MFKKCKVVMLPIIQRSKIGLNPSRLSKNKLYFFDPVVCNEAQALYFLSDEEIKEGDWYIAQRNTGPKLLKAKRIDKEVGCIFQENTDETYYPYDIHECKKIIASTNSSLGLPRPSDSFIKKYCELGGINEVMVEYEEVLFTNGFSIEINTKELHDKVITRLKVAPDNTITIKKVKDSWTREEVIILIGKMQAEGIITPNITADKFDKWIEQNL